MEIPIHCTYDKLVATDSLQGNPANPNTHPAEQIRLLKKIIKQQGWRQPIKVSELSGFVVSGHARLQAAKELGIAEVPVDYQPYSCKELEEADLLADNRLAALAENDLPSLKNMLEGIDTGLLESLGADIELTGYTEQAMADLMSQFHVDEVTEDEPPEPPKIAVTQKGDVWVCGKHRILCGDSTKAEDVGRLMQGEKAGFVFADPPYEMDTKGGGLFQESSAMKGIRDANLDSFEPSLLVRQAETSLYCCNKPLIPKYIALAELWGVAWDIAIYRKENITPNYGGHLMTDVEYLMILGKQSPITGQEKELYSKVYTGGKDIENKLAWSKPVGLCAKFIKLYLPANQNVLDPFLGSGTTMIAAEQLGRRCFGMEIAEQYCDVSVLRWQKLTGKDATLESSGETFAQVAQARGVEVGA